MHVRTEIEIDAKPEACWKVLEDFSAYPQWNPVISQVTGAPRAGGKGGIKIKLGPGPALPVPMVFINVEPNKELRWRGGNDLVFSGEHYFELQAIDGGKRTRLVHGENFQGIVVKLLKPLLESQIERTYSDLNQAFKRRVESQASKG